MLTRRKEDVKLLSTLVGLTCSFFIVVVDVNMSDKIVLLKFRLTLKYKKNLL